MVLPYTTSILPIRRRRDLRRDIPFPYQSPSGAFQTSASTAFPARLSNPAWWQREIEWTLLSPFYPTIGESNTSVHKIEVVKNLRCFEVVIHGGGLGAEDFLRQFALDPAEINGPQWDTLWKLVTITGLIRTRDLRITPSMLEMISDTHPAPGVSKNGSRGVKMRVVYGALSSWEEWLDSADDHDRLDPITPASIKLITDYLHALCDEVVEGMEYIDVPITCNPYSASGDESKDVIRLSLDTDTAFDFIKYAFSSNTRSTAWELGLHHASEAFIRKFPDAGLVATAAREEYAKMDQEQQEHRTSRTGSSIEDGIQPL